MATLEEVQQYWSTYSLGLDTLSKDKYQIEAYQSIKEKHDKAYAHANKLLDFTSLAEKSVLELACGIGLDTIEFAKHSGHATALDISSTCIHLAKDYIQSQRLSVDFTLGNAEELCFSNDSFDIVVARGILMYTPHPEKVIRELWRVLKPQGKAYILLHNKLSWYALLAKLSGQNFYNEVLDPPVNRLHTVSEVRLMLNNFSHVYINLDRFPSEAMNRKGFLPSLYNHVFVPLMKAVPKAAMKPFGYYIIVEAMKA